jgi:putative membrane protein
VADPQTRTRDLLANERTFLAWLRTAAAVMVLGLAIAKFGDAPGSREIVAGTLLVVVGAAGVFEGERRRRTVERAIEEDRPIATGGELVAALVLVASVLAALLLLLV